MDELGIDIFEDCLDYLIEHSGTPQMYDFDPNGSGRYRQGSGETPYQRACSLQARNARLKAEGFTEKERATALGYSSIDAMRADISKQSNVIKAETARQCWDLYNKGYSKRQIAIQVFGTPTKDTTVNNMLKPFYLEKTNTNERVKQVLREAVDKYQYVDVGIGVEHDIDIPMQGQTIHGISNNRLGKCVQQLVNDEGYVVYDIDVPQVMTHHNTTVKTLCAPGTKFADVASNKLEIGTVKDYFIDNGQTRCGIQDPVPLDPSRVAIRYAEDGGKLADGTMYIRRGVEDVSLGSADYAQVRIDVGGTHYLKGMAMYGPDSMFEPGIDIVFNTNKTKDVPMMGEDKNNTVLKPLKSDPENPFGATIKHQVYYEDPNGEFVKVPDKNGFQFVKDDGTHGDLVHHSLGVANIVNEEGDWGEWSKTIASQMLSKQPIDIIKPQLDMTYKEKKDEFDEIMSITQPEVKKKLLMEFADSCDSDAVDLKAAGFPGQATHVILPIPGMPENEIYAPRYPDGTHVILIRYPHASTTEIPYLVVNNNRKEAIDILGKTPSDAVGISAKVAEQLSGADFDGDTVQVIPADNIKFDHKKQMEGMKTFDPHVKYRGYDGMPEMTDEQKAVQMGLVSNLITDMNLKGAPPEHIERALKHSMVVIDAQKHHLDWKASEAENNIVELRMLYQGRKDGGASTLISKAGGQAYVVPRVDYKDIPQFNDDGSPKMVIDKRSGKEKQATKRFYIDPETGKKLHTDSPSTYTEYSAVECDADGNPIRIDNGKGGTKTRTIKLYKKNRDPQGRLLDEPKFYDKKGNLYTGPIDKIKVKEASRQQETTKMAKALDETGSAHSLIIGAGHKKERLYADYADAVYNLGNRARLETLSIEDSKPNPQAKKVYKETIDILMGKLKKAQENAPRERQAQRFANETIHQQKMKYPNMTKEEYKKKKGQALAGARTKFGAKKESIVLTPKEWEAIMAGAIPKSTLKKILDNCDTDELKKLAIPKDTTISDSKVARITSLSTAGWTISEIAERTGVSESTVSKVLVSKKRGE